VCFGDVRAVQDVEALLFSLDPTPVVAADLVSYWSAHVARVREAERRPIDDAILGGFHADRVGYAFAAGYHAALRALVPSLPRDHVVSLCATEAGGAHPRAIETRLFEEGGALLVDGRKRWATMSTAARTLLVLATRGTDAAGRRSLVLVRVPADARGVTRTPMEAPPFAPEIPHAEVTLERVAVSSEDVLPGDGWEMYVKPFRTIEDVHVMAAALGHHVALARRVSAPDEIVARLVACVVLVRAIAAEEPRRAETHVALAGLWDLARGAIDALEPFVGVLGAEERERRGRDLALFHVADRARASRTQTAFERLRGARP
jgi:alkylation response protein AidB-like acyl-CoA dehydrogenase